MSRQIYAVCLKCLLSLVLLLVIASPSLGQSADRAAVTGIVQDTSDARISNADVKLINTDTGTESNSKTSNDGAFALSGVMPGHYTLQIERGGFDTTQLTGITLNVGDNKSVVIRMKVGSSSQTVTVDGSGLVLNTTDASVGTVVDRQFVQNMPLNGRSFQSLILLAPGVVTATPQNGASQGVSGEFTVNGQRADSNNFIVDGVSADNSPNPNGYSSAGSAGALPATTALGTTQALISVDALQEFKILTSTYSAEYGREPGAQISFETRAGTNDWHGSVFDYVRNNIFDANNWFNDNTTPITPKPAERQNDFGGTVGGPLGIPAVYSGLNRTFFFFSYEGLRLTQPQPASIYYVPSTEMRQSAPQALQPILNAFPLPNCTTATDAECIDPGNGLSPFLLSTSLPSNLDSISARVDESVASWLHLFIRYGSADSSADTLASTYRVSTVTDTKSLTVGGDSAFGPDHTNQFRFNYAYGSASAPYAIANYDGAIAVNPFALNSYPSDKGYVSFRLVFPGYSSLLPYGTSFSKQSQWNVLDTLAWKWGHHFLRFGIDYRRTDVTAAYKSPSIQYTYSSSTAVANNSPSASASISAEQYPEYTNFSAFAQDEWRLSEMVNLSLGVRWELNPPPTVTSGPASRTINGDLNDPSTLTLAPEGTPLYQTTFYNFAPRIGMAAALHRAPEHELIFRTGGGVFFDTGQQTNSIFGEGGSPGTGFTKSYSASTASAFPLTSFLSIPLADSLTPPYSTIYTTSQHLQLPYSFQWNATLEQALGRDQSISLGYIGSNGRRLLHYYAFQPANPLFTYLAIFNNGLSSSYNSLQVQYKRTLSKGLQVLGSYTWSHAIDYESQDIYFYPYLRGDSDTDVRNNFTAALSYDIPKTHGSAISNALINNWGIDLRLTARSGFPVPLLGNEVVDPATGDLAYGGLNYLGGPIYTSVPTAPGGRVINAASFSLPTGSALGNAPRNFVRGFGENEINLAIRREFPVYEHIHLQFRAEAFNVLNHPNFGFIDTTYGNVQFGRATETLASSIGGLTSLYQQGGPRSLQFALRVYF